MRPDNVNYMSKGYVPLREQYDNSVSHALEYYIADFALSRFAEAIWERKRNAKCFITVLYVISIINSKEFGYFPSDSS